MKTTKGLCFAAAILLLLSTAGPAFAQEDTGNVYVKVLDTGGNPLPGVTVELTGMGAPRIMVTNTSGEARFLGLDPGTVSLRASLEGFSSLEYPSVDVRVARNTSLELQLTEAIGEVITVTAESPLLDERRIATGTTVTQIELESIPTARDPWALLNQTQGVAVDRINVGGNESGQQAVFLGQGVTDDENSFLVDGVQITDMAAIGSSPTYYDFDQFSEVQMSTGGADVSQTAAGVSVNMVTKRGTNEFRGSGRYFVTDGGGVLGIFDQADPSIPDSDLGPGQNFFAGNRIRRVEDFGFEAGGPILRDSLWVWGSWGQNDIANLIPGSTSNPDAIPLNDDTILENTSVKFNGQITDANSAIFSWNNGDKVKLGRDASPTRPQETTFNQRGPTAIWKLEDTHIVNSNLFVSGSWSKVDGGFTLTPQGGAGPESPNSWRDANSVWHDSFLYYTSSRPAQELKADGSYFFSTGSATSHELKFGARYREFEVRSLLQWPGTGGFYSLALGGGTFPLDVAVRGGASKTVAKYTSLWASDTISMGRWTINAGLRWDLQDGETEDDFFSGIPCGASTALYYGEVVDTCEVMPDISPAGEQAPFDWSDIQPRLGVTYALGEERKTLLRASFSQFAEQLETNDINFTNAGYYAYAYFYNLTDAANPDPNRRWNPGDRLEFLFGAYGFEPKNPTLSGNRVDPGLSAPLTSEIVVGAEHALLPEFVVGLNATWRNTDDVLEFRDFIRSVESFETPGRIATVDDYVENGTFEGTLPNGRDYSVPYYGLRDGLEHTGGRLLINGDREVGYVGAGLNFTKRLANQWMLRGYVNFANQEWSIGDQYRLYNDPNAAEFGQDVDAGVFAVQSTGSGGKGDVVMQSSWSWNLNGMYQIAPDKPWGFNIAANLYGREGYPMPYMLEYADTGDDITRNVRVVGDVDEIRVDDILTTDLRFEKEFAATSGLGFTFSIDAFNIFNENYVLQRERNLDSGTADWLRETLSPRIWRLGVRINWR